MTATISDIKRTDGRAVTVRAAGGIELAEAELKSGGRVEGFRRRRIDRQTDRQTTRRMRDVSREVIISVGGGRQKQDRKSSERRLIDR